MLSTSSLSACEAARRLGVSVTAVRKRIASGSLRSAQPHPHAPHQIDAGDVERLAAAREARHAARRRPEVAA